MEFGPAVKFCGIEYERRDISAIVHCLPDVARCVPDLDKVLEAVHCNGCPLELWHMRQAAEAYRNGTECVVRDILRNFDPSTGALRDRYVPPFARMSPVPTGLLRKLLHATAEIDALSSREDVSDEWAEQFRELRELSAIIEGRI